MGPVGISEQDVPGLLGCTTGAAKVTVSAQQHPAILVSAFSQDACGALTTPRFCHNVCSAWPHTAHQPEHPQMPEAGQSSHTPQLENWLQVPTQNTQQLPVGTITSIPGIFTAHTQLSAHCAQAMTADGLSL